MHRLLSGSLLVFVCCSVALADGAPTKDAFGDPLPPGAVARLRAERVRHPDARISALAFTPDGKSIASCGGQFVVVWDVPNGNERRRFKFEDDNAQKVLFSPDGKFLAAASPTRLTVWPADGGKPVLNFTTENKLEHLAFADGGKTLVAVEAKQSEKVAERSIIPHRWETATGKELEAPKLTAATVAFLTPNGKTAYTVGAKDERQIVNLADGTEAPWPKGLPALVTASSAHGKYLAGVDRVTDKVTRDAVAWVWDPMTDKTFHPPATKTAQKPDCAALTPDGELFVVMTRPTAKKTDIGFRVEVYNRTSHRKQATFYTKRDREDEPRLNAWAFSPGGETLAVGNGHTIDLFDLKTGEPKEIPDAIASVRAVAFAPDGKTVGVLPSGGKVQLWDPVEGKFFKTVGDPATCFAFSADSKRLATADAAGRDDKGQVRPLRIWDIETGQSQAKIMGFREPFGLVRLVDNDRKLVATMGPKFTGAFDPVSGKVLWNRINDVSFGPVGKPLHDGFGGTWAVRDGRLSHWNAATDKTTEVGLTPADANDVWRLACNGKVLVIEDGTRNCYRVWDMENKRWAHPVLPIHAGLVWGAPNNEDKYESPRGATAFHLSEDGKYFVKTERWRADGPKVDPVDPEEAKDGEGAQVRVWDLTTGREIARVGMGTLRLRTLALSADGKRLITAHVGAAPLVWDLEKFTKLAPLPVTELKAEELELRWLELIQHNPIEANRAVWPLVRGGPKAAKFVAEKLLAKQPVEAPAEKVAAWVKELDDADEGTRWRAYLELANQVPAAKDAVFKAVNNKVKTPEGNRLVRNLVNLIRREDMAAKLRDARAIEILELMNTADALAALKKVAESDAPSAESAKSAAARVEKRLP